MKRTLYRPVSDQYKLFQGAKYPLRVEGGASYQLAHAEADMERLRAKYGGNWHIIKTVDAPGYGVGVKWEKV